MQQVQLTLSEVLDAVTQYATVKARRLEGPSLVAYLHDSAGAPVPFDGAVVEFAETPLPHSKR